MDAVDAAATLRDLGVYTRGRSALYERLLAGLAGAAERGFDGGVIARLLTTPGPANANEARMLLLAALHHAALEDPSRPHAAWFPTARPDEARPAGDGAPAALALAYLVEHEAEVATFLGEQRLQTNEIGRCTALLPGFLLAAGFGLPLHLLELGASAGLALRFDRYRYRYTDGPEWGPANGPELWSRAEGAVPRALAPPSVEIEARRGVDLNPIDPADPAGARLLTSFVWPDERDRQGRLEQAIAIARSTPAAVDRGDLLTWARREAVPHDGAVTVVFESVVRHLLDDATVTRLRDVLDGALRRATPDAPVAVVALESPGRLEGPEPTYPELTVGLGDGSGPPSWRTLLEADFHGRWVRWY